MNPSQALNSSHLRPPCFKMSEGVFVRSIIKAKQSIVIILTALFPLLQTMLFKKQFCSQVHIIMQATFFLDEECSNESFPSFKFLQVSSKAICLFSSCMRSQGEGTTRTKKGGGGKNGKLFNRRRCFSSAVFYSLFFCKNNSLLFHHTIVVMAATRIEL